MVPPDPEVEVFFTRLRKELLILIAQEGKIPQPLLPLTEALAAQCFLNEYVYSISQEEEKYITQLIDLAADSQEAINQYLAIIGCYKPIYATSLKQEAITNYPVLSDQSKVFIASQFHEPLQELELKSLFEKNSNTRNSTSQLVQQMYENNPYPRYRYADYTPCELAKPVYSSRQLRRRMI